MVNPNFGRKFLQKKNGVFIWNPEKRNLKCKFFSLQELKTRETQKGNQQNNGEKTVNSPILVDNFCKIKKAVFTWNPKKKKLEMRLASRTENKKNPESKSAKKKGEK